MRAWSKILPNVNMQKLNYFRCLHDQLTGLFNRNDFHQQIGWNLAIYHQHPTPQHSAFAVLFVDLDRFKVVNDSMGTLGGRSITHWNCSPFIARNRYGTWCGGAFWGGWICVNSASFRRSRDFGTTGWKIQHQLSRPYTLEQQIFNTTASIGIALGTQEYQDPEEMLRDADIAMYEAKYRGRGRIMIFQEGMHTQVVNLLRMESDLRKALERKEFRLYYQPIISLKNTANCQPWSLSALGTSRARFGDAW